MTFDITLDLLEEMAECIYTCDWESDEEIFEYMKSCITDSNQYEPEAWKSKETNKLTIENEQ